jgi:hypothetical protein
MAAAYYFKLMVYFLTISTLKSESYINNNVDDEQLKIFLQRVQKVHLASLLGNEFYAHLVDAIENTTLTAAETTLISDYLKPLIISLTEIKATVFLKTQFRKKTVGENNDEFMRSSSKDLLNDLYSEKKKFENDVLNYLCDNSTDFPLFVNSTTNGYNNNIAFV